MNNTSANDHNNGHNNVGRHQQQQQQNVLGGNGNNNNTLEEPILQVGQGHVSYTNEQLKRQAQEKFTEISNSGGSELAPTIGPNATMPSYSTIEQQQQRQQYHYGTMEVHNNNNNPQQQPSYPQQGVILGGTNYNDHHSSHNFHYSNPDLHDVYPHDDMHVHDGGTYTGMSTYQTQNHYYNSRRSSPNCFFIYCLINPIKEYINMLYYSENLHRSLCFGSIDGMLTGSSILSTFLGMNLLTTNSPIQIKLLIIIFTFTTCFADSICMFIGHIWSTYILSVTTAIEQRNTRLTFINFRFIAKKKLVNMLLSRGMLKIDAMSIADTLEGYPDIFISALNGSSNDVGTGTGTGTGDGGGGGGGSATGGGGGGALNLGHHPHSGSENWISGESPTSLPLSSISLTLNPTSTNVNEQQNQQNQNQQNNTSSSNDFTSSQASQSTTTTQQQIKYHYDMMTLLKKQHNMSLDEDKDPECEIISTAIDDSRNEGIIMMISFAIFATIPSILFYLLSILIFYNDNNDNNSSHISSNTTSTSENLSIISLLITIISIIMILLGIWKSKFFVTNHGGGGGGTGGGGLLTSSSDNNANSSSSNNNNNNWIMFGIETELVLLLCIVSAYFVGYGLSSLLYINNNNQISFCM